MMNLNIGSRRRILSSEVKDVILEEFIRNGHHYEYLFSIAIIFLIETKFNFTALLQTPQLSDAKFCMNGEVPSSFKPREHE